MQKKYGFKPLGAADGPVKTAIFCGNNMRLYGVQKRTDSGDRFAAMKQEYLKNGAARSNLRYGYVRKPSSGRNWLSARTAPSRYRDPARNAAGRLLRP